MGREQLGHQRRVRRVGHRLDGQAQGNRGHDQPIVAGVHHRETNEAPERGEHRAGQVHRFAPDDVGQITHQRDQEEVQQVRTEHQQQNLRRVLVHHQFQVGDRERDHGVVEDVLGEPCTNPHQHRAPVMTQHFHHAQLLLAGLRLACLAFLEDRRVIDTGANPVADQHHHGREPERHAPAPGEELLLRQVRRQQQQGDSRNQITGRYAGLWPTGPEASAIVRAVFGYQQNRAAPFTAEGKPLDQPQQHQQQRRRITDLVEAGQAAHQESGDADHHQAQLQQALAAEFVTVVTEHQATQRAGQKTHGVEGEGGDDAVDGVVGLAEEQLAENQCRGGAVEKEFIPFGDGAGHRGGDDALESRGCGCA
ncbi:hypothetical protein D3C87_1324600 [compost metagenome]